MTAWISSFFATIVLILQAWVGAAPPVAPAPTQAVQPSAVIASGTIRSTVVIPKEVKLPPVSESPVRAATSSTETIALPGTYDRKLERGSQIRFVGESRHNTLDTIMTVVAVTDDSVDIEFGPVTSKKRTLHINDLAVSPHFIDVGGIYPKVQVTAITNGVVTMHITQIYEAAF